MPSQPRAYFMWWRSGTAVLYLLLALLWQTSPASGAPAQLQLIIELDRHEFLPGEPIKIGITLQNVGDEPFTDLAPLAPSGGFLSLVVSRDGEPVDWTTSEYTWVFVGEGPRLAPGGQICDVFDLLTHFGSRKTVLYAGKSVEFRRVLDPGTYTVRPVYRARLRAATQLPQVIVDGNDVHFVVRGPTAIPPAEVPALELIGNAEMHGDEQSPGEIWDRIGELGLYRSRYLPSLARMYMPAVDDTMDAASLAEGYVAAGGGRLTWAGVLKVRYERFSNRFTACEAWLQRSTSTGETFACYLRTWSEYLQARRKSRESDD